MLHLSRERLRTRTLAECFKRSKLCCSAPALASVNLLSVQRNAGTAFDPARLLRRHGGGLRVGRAGWVAQRADDVTRLVVVEAGRCFCNARASSHRVIQDSHKRLLGTELTIRMSKAKASRQVHLTTCSVSYMGLVVSSSRRGLRPLQSRSHRECLNSSVLTRTAWISAIFLFIVRQRPVCPLQNNWPDHDIRADRLCPYHVAAVGQAHNMVRSHLHWRLALGDSASSWR